MAEEDRKKCEEAYWSRLKKLGEDLFRGIAEYKGGDTVIIDGIELRMQGDWSDLIFFDREKKFVGGIYLPPNAYFGGHVGMLKTRGMRGKGGIKTSVGVYNFGHDGREYFMGTEVSDDGHIYGNLVKIHPLKFMVEQYRSNPHKSSVLDAIS